MRKLFLMAAVLLLATSSRAGTLKAVGSGGGGSYNPAAVAITGGTISGVKITNSQFALRNTSLSASTTISAASQSFSYNATGGAITQVLPSIASMSAFDQQIIEFWKTDSSANAVTITSTDGFLGLGNSQSLSVQGASLILKVDVPSGTYKVMS